MMTLVRWPCIALVLLAVSLALGLSPVRSAAVAHAQPQAPMDPDAALRAFLARAFPSRPFVGPCEEVQFGRDAGKLCATLEDVHDTVVAYHVAIVQTDAELWVFIAPFAGEWRIIAVAGSSVWPLTVAGAGPPWPWPADESTSLSEALTRLEAELPSTASAVMVRLFRFTAASLAWLQFEQADETGPRAAPNSTQVRPQRFDRIYAWTGADWALRVDSYQLTTDLFGPALIGRLAGGLPQADTAHVELIAQPLPGRTGETGAMPDVLALVVGYREGPTRAAEVQPALALIPVMGMDLEIAFTLDLSLLNVRTWPDLVVRLGDEVLVTAPLFLRGDRPCCPSGTLVLRIGWQEGQFVIVERCEQPGRRVTRCR